MYFEYNRKEAKAYAKFLLKKHFTAKNLLNGGITFDEIKEYVDSISGSVKNWFYTYSPSNSNLTNMIKHLLEKLNRIGFGAFRPLIMAAMNKNIEYEKMELLLFLIERFNFLVFLVSRRNINTLNSHFYRKANDFHKQICGIDNILNDIISSLYEWHDTNNFIGFINDKYNRDEGFYSWNGLKYFLYEYESRLQNSFGEGVKITWEEFDKREKEDTIEHIYPQIPQEEDWPTFNSMSTENKGYLLNSLGNLLLLSRFKNSTLQNICFKNKKRSAEGDIGYFNGSFSEIEVAQKEDWTPNEILERGLKLLEFMESQWNIKLGSYNEKIKLLNLEFLINSRS